MASNYDTITNFNTTQVIRKLGEHVERVVLMTQQRQSGRAR